MVQVTCRRWPPRPYMVKTFKNLLLQNRKFYDLEIWHAASGSQALQIIIKSLDPLRAKKTFITKKLGHTMASAIKASSVTLCLYKW